MSHYNLLNLLTASDFAPLNDTVSLNNTISLNSAVSLSDTVSFSNTAGCSRLSFLIFLSRLTSFALLNNEGNYETE